nr:zinc finger, CCHC-type [Tanacetum cinerariifolium]
MFHSCKQAEGQFVSDHVLLMKSYLDQLATLNYAFPDKVSNSFILNSLSSEFQAFVQNYMQSMEKTISEVHSMLIEFEKSIKRNKQPIVGASSTPQVMAIQGGRVQKYKPQGKAKGKEKGRKLEKELSCVSSWVDKKKKKIGGQNVASTSSGIYTIELFAFPKNSWMYDTGCGTHICNTKQGLRGAKKLKRSSLYFKMTRKPFSHKTEKVKDVLGLIHTDVCGPLRHVSKKGASYFITFTDDYSRYGYVYLLKHKHEVFETFKAHVKRHTPDKLQQRSVKCIFVRYPKETMGYYFYYPPENKIVVKRYADFLEKDFILQKESGRNIELEDEDILPSENTSEHPIEEESLAPIVSQEEDVIHIRRS